GCPAVLLDQGDPAGLGQGPHRPLEGAKVQPGEASQLGPLEPARPGVEAEPGEGLQDPVAEDGLGPERMSPADEVGRDAHTAAGADGADGPAQRLSLWTAVRREPPGGGEPAEGFVDGGTCQAGAFHQLPRVMRPLRAAEG